MSLGNEPENYNTGGGKFHLKTARMAAAPFKIFLPDPFPIPMPVFHDAGAAKGAPPTRGDIIVGNGQIHRFDRFKKTVFEFDPQRNRAGSGIICLVDRRDNPAI